MKQYSIPFYQKSNSKWYINLLYLLGTIVYAASSILCFVFFIKLDFASGLVIGLLTFMLSFFCAYMFISERVLKRFYIEMTSEYIKISVPFKSKITYWKEVYEAQVCELNYNTVITILLEKDRHKKRRTIFNNFNSLYGVPQYSFNIPLARFKDINAETLLLTIKEQINKVNIKDKIRIENYEEYHDSMIKAIITSVLFCIITSFVYGFTIYLFEKNYVAIPIIGCCLIISAFNKYYSEKSFNLIIRLLLGIVCLIQVPTAIIGASIISKGLSVTLNDILSVTNEYFKYLLHNPSNEITVIILAIICFSIGALKGRTNKEKIKLDI